MNRKRILALFVVFVLAGAYGFAQKDQPVKSIWTPAMPMIDGLNIEWAEDASSVDKATGVEYGFRNDGNYFYAIFVLKDPKKKSSMDLTGVTMYFNVDGKKKKDNGIRFFRRVLSAEQMVASLEQQGEVLTETQKASIRAQKVHELFLYDIVDEKEKKSLAGVPITDPPVFKSVQVDKTTVSYEFRIPLAKDEAHPIGVGAAPGHTIMAGFEWGGITDRSLAQMAAQMNQAETAASERGSNFESFIGEGAEGTGSGMRGDGDMSRLRARMPKKYNIWATVTLAVNE